MNPPVVSRLRIANYKSIALCDLRFGPLTILVGRNGAGKSNILDALRFVTDALNKTLEFAVRERGGIAQIRRRPDSSRNGPTSIRVELVLSGGRTGVYSFEIVPRVISVMSASIPGMPFHIGKESCLISGGGGPDAWFDRLAGKLHWSLDGSAPAVAPDRLGLVAASGAEPFREVFDALSGMIFHNLNPEVMKRPQPPESGERLAYDGHNIASVVRQTEAVPGVVERVLHYLHAVGVPLIAIEHQLVGGYETIAFRQAPPTVEGRHGAPPGRYGLPFNATSMSDGTIRAFGILVSVLSAARRGGVTPLVAIEEPESALHPAAAGALVDALFEATRSAQILVSTHSPDLLDHPSIQPEMIRVVACEDRVTKAGALSKVKQDLLRDLLATTGEMLRLDQLTIDPSDSPSAETVFVPNPAKQ